jgi:cytochrome P450
MTTNLMATKQAPLAPGLPILGNALQLGQATRAFLFEKHLELGPVYRVRALNREFTVLAGVEANQFMIRNGRSLFRSREFWQELDAELGADRSLISMDGDDHSRMRKAQKSGYSRSVILNNIPQVIAMTGQEIDSWPVGEPLPGLYSLQRIITEQLGYLAAGYSPRAYLDDMITFVRTLLVTKVTKQRPNFFTYLPTYRKAKARALELAQQVHDVHQTSPEVSGRPRDLIDDLFQLAAEDPDFLPTSDLMPALLGPFIAGLDTAASTTAFMLYALLRDDGLRASVTAEVDEVWSGEITPQSVRSLDLLHRTALETLRMYPIAPALTRTVDQPFEFKGYQFEEGTTVLLATTVPHYLPELYPDPERFDIERYTPERKEHKPLGAFAPFGLGSHTCLGAGLAEVQIMLTMGTLLYKLDMEMWPSDYTLKIDPAPTPSPDSDFQFRIKRKRQEG